MNVVNFIISNKFLAPSVCFVSGYALSRASIAVNQFVVKYLGLPIDIMNHKEYNEYTNDIVESNRKFADSNCFGLDRQIGAVLVDVTVMAICEEISYRFLLETIVLPCIYPQFAVFSIARTCVSSLLFAANNSLGDFSSEQRAGRVFHAGFLGVVCSLAQQRIGLIGSIFVHIGFNLHGFQWSLNQNLADVVKKIRAVKLIDVIHPVKIGTYLGGFIDDAEIPAGYFSRVSK